MVEKRQPRRQPTRRETGVRNNKSATEKQNGVSPVAVGLAALLGAAGIGLGAYALGQSENGPSYEPNPTTPTLVTPDPGNCVDVPMDSGESRGFPAGAIVSGDVVVNGQRLYDDSEQTALVVELTQQAQVTAPYGADVQYGENCDTSQDVANAKRAEGFAEVVVLQVPQGGETTVTTREGQTNCVDVPMDSGESQNLPAGSVVSGDVAVNGQRLYDDSEQTALVVELTQDAQVTAPYGADAQYGNFCDTAEDVANAKRAEGFARVDVVKAP